MCHLFYYLKHEYNFLQLIAVAARSLKYVKTNISIWEGIGLIRFGMKADLKNIPTYRLPEEGTFEIKRDRIFRVEVDFDKATDKVHAFINEEPV